MLEIRNIDVNYGTIQSLWNVSITVSDGEFVAIIGANGAGKSTLFRTISGEIKPQNGQIEINGKRIDGMEPEEIVKMGIVQVPEGKRLFPDLTVLQNLMMGAFTLGNQRERIKSLLEQIFQLFPSLAQRQRQAAVSLSGGEQQMLAIGRGLMADAIILLLDEPSLGLSPILSEVIFDRIVQIHKGGKTILMVEQNVEVALGIAKRAYVLERGKIVLSGEANQLRVSDEVKKAYLGRA